MKKFILIILLSILFINKIYAVCDNNKVVEYGKYASNINYEISYSKKTKKFNVVVYNLLNDMAIKSNSEYLIARDSKVEIKNIEQGNDLKINILPDINCDTSISILFVTVPYYNEFYNNSKCANYKMLNACSEEFLSYKLDEEGLDEIINNYESRLKNEKKEEEIKETDFQYINTIVNFFKKWGFKILIVIIVSIITIIPLRIKLRKVKYRL